MTEPVTPPVDAEATAPTADRRPGPRPWRWAAIACLMLGASGLVRIAQEQQFAEAAETAEAAPFPMRSLPAEIGSWRMVGEERTLPEETLQIAGCSDYISRQYIDDRIGVTLLVLVAFGPAERVFGHSPLACFPAVGYERVAGPRRRMVAAGSDTLPDEDGAPFDALVYSRPNGGAADLVEVYYSFRHAGLWSPTAASTSKQFRHRPAMFKIQVERPIVPGEVAAEQESPTEEFLAALVPIIERRLAEASAPAAE